MLIVDQPQLLPGECFLTKSHVGPFIDTLVETDVETPVGRVYLCRDIVLDMAAKFGALAPEAAEQLRADIVHYRSEAIAANERARALQAANDALVAAGYTIPDVVDTDGVSEAIEAGVFPAATETEEVHT